MSQNITLLGASYSDVPAVNLPKTGGGTATFTDVTDTTAAAADVASGKYFYTAAGVKTQGTSSGGGTAVKKKTGTFTGNGQRSITVSCDFEPDLVYWSSDPGSSASSGTVSCIIAREMMAANRYRNNSTTNSANIQTPITGMNTSGSSYNFRATWENNTVTLYSFSTNARNVFTNNRTYSFTFIKWT